MSEKEKQLRKEQIFKELLASVLKGEEKNDEKQCR